MFESLIVGFPPFLFYLAVGVALLLVVMTIYKAVTPHDEIKLIRENNAAAATGLAGGMIGLTLPIASASLNSVNLVDFVIWGAISCLVQIIAFIIASIFVPKLHARITEGHVSAGIYAGGFAIAFGILNAVSMVP